MALNVGDRFRHYDVTGLLGEGTMGQVWEATDIQLNRQVALKILPDALADDPDRLARFQREAQILASLNHPGIAQIYGIEEDGGTRALVLELVEGPTLADRIANGPVPLDEALPIAGQIAEAVEAAHEAGVIHRDLKPANIKVREDGAVKVLDFGLAKALDATPEGDPSQSPTLTAAATQMGAIMGTAAYMAPEQARGRPVDRRADIWAFGAIVFEMLTGRRAFEGDDVAVTLANVIHAEPAWERCLDRLSPTLQIFLKRCLEKDPRHRVQAVGDMRLALAGAFETGAPGGTAPGAAQAPRTWPWLALVVLMTTAAGLGAWHLNGSPTPAPTRWAFQLPSDVTPGRGMAVAPDGGAIVVSGRELGLSSLYQRTLSSFQVESLSGTGGASDPFFSPGGDWLGFFSGSTLMKRSRAGRSVVVSELDAVPSGATWTADDTIVYSLEGRLWSISSDGGAATSVPVADSADGVALLWPDALPDGAAVVVTVRRPGPSGTLGEVGVVDLATGALEPRFAGSYGRYLRSGHLVYALNEALWAVPFDASRRRLTGPAVQVVTGLSSFPNGFAPFAVGQNGTLVYEQPGERVRRSLVWVDRGGGAEPISMPSRAYLEPRLSPDGTHLAVSVADGQADIWTSDLGRGTEQRLTFHPGVDAHPLWTPDGQRIIFYSDGRDGGAGIFWKPSDGSGDPERLSSGDHRPRAITTDGAFVLYADFSSGDIDIGWLALQDDAEPRTLLATSLAEGTAAVSPDGAWLAYVTGLGEVFQPGRPSPFAVFARPFSDLDAGLWQLSPEDGGEPLWSRDGSELFYRSRTDMMAITVGDGPPATWGAPRVLFQDGYFGLNSVRTYDVGPDGRFLMVTDDVAGSTGVVVIEHWTTELAARVPVD